LTCPAFERQFQQIDDNDQNRNSERNQNERQLRMLMREINNTIDSCLAIESKINYLKTQIIRQKCKTLTNIYAVNCFYLTEISLKGVYTSFSSLSTVALFCSDIEVCCAHLLIWT
jgi:hypothetical protein